MFLPLRETVLIPLLTNNLATRATAPHPLRLASPPQLLGMRDTLYHLTANCQSPWLELKIIARHTDIHPAIRTIRRRDVSVKYIRSDGSPLDLAPAQPVRVPRRQCSRGG